MSRRTYAPLDALEARRICQLGAAILAGLGPVEEAPLWDDDERWGLVAWLDDGETEDDDLDLPF